MGEPTSEAAVLRDAVLGEQSVSAGFADHQGFEVFTVLQERKGAVLVGVEFSYGASVEEATHESAEVAGVEPGLGFEPEGVEGAVVAGEKGGGAMNRYFLYLCVIAAS